MADMKNHGLNQVELHEMLENSIHTPFDQVKYEQKILKELYGNQTEQQKFDSYLDGSPAHVMHMTEEGGKIKIIELVQKSNQDTCIIDWLNFTVNEESFNTDTVLSDNDLILLASETLQTIFGFGITVKKNNGLMFYDRSYVLGDDYGHVCHGGQNNTILVSLNGTGLIHSRDNWESRLFHFLEVSISPSITRVDLAHDIYNAPQFLIDHFLTVYDKGGFTNYRNKPAISLVGNWHTSDSKGRTIYIGNRSSGLYFRIYEKGKQLQSQDYPNWLRLEGELKSANRIIPHDVLLRPQDYFAGLYPCLKTYVNKFSRIQTFKNELNSDFDNRVKWAKHQSGGFIKLMTELGNSPDEILDLIQGNKIPKQWMRKFFGNTKPSIHTEPDSVDYSLIQDF